MFIIGVYTSTKSIFVRQFLTQETTLDLIMNVSLDLLFMIISRYLFLYLLSLSLNPVWASGNMCKQGESSLTSSAAMESSQVAVLPGKPTTPIISPLRIVEWSSSKFLSTLLLFQLHMTCSLSPSCFRSQKTNFFPWRRMLVTLAARDTCSQSHLDFYVIGEYFWMNLWMVVSTWNLWGQGQVLGSFLRSLTILDLFSKQAVGSRISSGFTFFSFPSSSLAFLAAFSAFSASNLFCFSYLFCCFLLFLGSPSVPASFFSTFSSSFWGAGSCFYGQPFSIK